MRSGKATSVDTVVDVIVDPGVDGSHGFLGRFRCKVQLWIRGKVVELAVQHLDDLGRLVVDDGLELLVPQDGHAILADHVLTHFIEVSDRLGTVESVLLDIGDLVGAKPIRIG